MFYQHHWKPANPHQGRTETSEWLSSSCRPLFSGFVRLALSLTVNRRWQSGHRIPGNMISWHRGDMLSVPLFALRGGAAGDELFGGKKEGRSRDISVCGFCSSHFLLIIKMPIVRHHVWSLRVERWDTKSRWKTWKRTVDVNSHPRGLLLILRASF